MSEVPSVFTCLGDNLKETFTFKGPCAKLQFSKSRKWIQNINPIFRIKLES